MAADLALPTPSDDDPPIFDELDEAIMQGATLTANFVDYVPADLDEAERAARRLRRLDERRREVEQQYAVWKAQLDGWRADELARIMPAHGLFTRWLEVYGVRARANEPKRATFALPSAEISTRQEKSASIVVDVEELVLEWARGALSSAQYEHVVRTTESVRISELRKIVEIVPQYADEGGETDELVGYIVVDPNTGAVVPGVTVDPPSTTAKVKLTS